MRVSDVMNRRVMTIRPTEPLSLAVQMMLWGGVRHLPVMEDGKLVGLLTERDVLRYRADAPTERPLEQPVREAMSAPAEYADPEDPLTEAMARMASEKITCLPVLQRGDLVGLLSSIDVLAHQVRANLGEAPEAGPLARDLMTADPVTASAEDYLLDAAARMSQAGVRHLPVVDGDGHLVGMLSDRDVRLAIGDPLRVLEEGSARARIEALRVRQMMNDDPLKIRTDTPVSLVLTAFTDWRIGALPVVDGSDRLHGIVSYVDVLRALQDRVS